LGEEGNLRDKVSRLMKAGELVGITRGIYLTAPELRKRPASREVLANMIYGPSYVSFEYVLARAGLIPEAVTTISSATPKRNRRFDTPIGSFSYRHLPPEAYRFGWTREELPDGAGFLIALPEKALLDWIYVSGAVRSVRALEAMLYEDLRLDADVLSSPDGALDLERLAAYAARMPGATFRIHLAALLGRLHG
jgi:predicted transcriptional regulator of viral defense system